MLLGGDINESVVDFIYSEFSSESAEQLINDLFYGTCELMFAHADAAHILLVHSDSEYPFTPNDLNWLDYATDVLMYRMTEGAECVFFFNVDCSFEDYYLICAAIIKVFNKAFPGVNIYFFKIEDSIAVGSARDFFSQDNDFTITGLFTERDLKNVNEESFFEMICYSDISDIPDVIMSYSPQEKDYSLLDREDQVMPGYLSFLSEFQSLYSIDTSQERQRWLQALENQVSYYTHDNTKKELEGVADADTVSSYEILDAAEKAEEKSKKIQYSTENSSEQENDVESKFSQEAFENAEQMLKEMLGNEKMGG